MKNYTLLLILMFSSSSQAVSLSLSGQLYEWWRYGETIEWPPYDGWPNQLALSGDFNIDINGFTCDIGECLYSGDANVNALIANKYSISSNNAYEQSIYVRNNTNNTSSTLYVSFKIDPELSDWDIVEGTRTSGIYFYVSHLAPITDQILPDFTQSSTSSSNNFQIWSASPDSWFSVDDCPCGYPVENWYALDANFKVNAVPLPPSILFLVTGLLPLLMKQRKSN